MQALQQLGIRMERQIPLTELLSENFNGNIYNMSKTSLRKVSALRDIVSQYNKDICSNVKEISTSRDSALLLRGELYGLKHEEVWVVYLSSTLGILDKEMVFKGSLAQTSIDARTILTRALSLSASAILLAHNHPSKDPSPSSADIRQTDKLRQACKTLEIALIDHIIISDGSYYSFADETVQEY